MLERKFVSQKIKEFQIQEFVAKGLHRAGHSHTKMQKTPLGEKIMVYSSRPGLVVGRKGQTIRTLTKELKKRFNLENPQIEISEVKNIDLDAQIVAETIANSLERFGPTKFKGIGHKTMTNVMNAGALGIEILISGKLPGSRAKRWRFYQGYLKKCGNISINGIDKAYTTAKLKTGVIGIQVRIMPPNIKLPDSIKLLEEKIEEIKEEQKEGYQTKEEKTDKKQDTKNGNNQKEGD